MSLPLILAIAAVTYLSRAIVLVAMPAPPPWLERILVRIPAPLFAGLAALALVERDGGLAPAPVLAALAGAVLVAPSRSFPLVLAGGIAGYALAVLVGVG